MRKNRRKGEGNEWHLGGSIYRFIWISRPLETLSLLLVLLLSPLDPSSIHPPSPFCRECFTFVVVVRTADIFRSVSSLNAFRWKSLLYYLYNAIFPPLSTRGRKYFSKWSLLVVFVSLFDSWMDGIERREKEVDLIIEWWMNTAMEESWGRNATRKVDKSSRPVSPVNSRDASPRETWIYLIDPERPPSTKFNECKEPH